MEWGHTQGTKALIFGLLLLCPLSSSFAGEAKLTSNFTTTASSLVDITGLIFTPAVSTTYELTGILYYSKNGTGSALAGWNQSGTLGAGARCCVRFEHGATSATACSVNTNFGSFGADANLNAMPFKGVFTTGASTTGNFSIRGASSGGGTLTVYAGSYFRWRQVSPTYEVDQFDNDAALVDESQTKGPTQEAVLNLLYNSQLSTGERLRPCPHSSCSPTPTPTVTPTATPGGTPSPTPTATSGAEVSDAVHQSNQFLVAFLGFLFAAVALWKFR